MTETEMDVMAVYYGEPSDLREIERAQRLADFATLTDLVTDPTPYDDEPVAAIAMHDPQDQIVFMRSGRVYSGSSYYGWTLHTHPLPYTRAAIPQPEKKAP